MAEYTVNADRLWHNIHDTAVFGGTADGGVSRLTLTEEDRQARQWLSAQAERLGCSIAVDEVGNMFILRPGRDTKLKPIAMGSHLDTQATGGKFDGVLGVLAGLEAIETLAEHNVATQHGIMLVNWTNEEGARFAPAMLGSGVHAGVFDRAYAESRRDRDGTSFGDALEATGFRGTLAAGQTQFAAMFELHIEQGPLLDRSGVEAGVVVGVQGMRWFDFTITGKEAHSGSTPMEGRRDALIAAARIILDVARLVPVDGEGMATVGRIEARPNSRNVIPGSVSLSVDIRHPRCEALDKMEAAVLRIAAAAKEHGCEIEIERIWDSAPVVFDAGCVNAVRQAMLLQGCTSRELYSGAGHDSVYVSRVAPTAMIFVPCRDGLSHNPAESASREECARGAQILLNAVLHYDREVACSD